MFEAFTSGGVINTIRETNAEKWRVECTISPAPQAGEVVKSDIPHGRPDRASPAS
jgi:hypothetical protein